MKKLLITALPLAITFSAHGACVSDSFELGDIGPNAERVCALLASQSQAADVRILDRKIQTPNIVHLTVKINGQKASQILHLRGADWQLVEPLTAGIQ